MKKHLQYLNYLVRHKWFVAAACFRRGLYWQGVVHDLSKFRPREWLPYAEFFYGTEKNRNAFDRAWLDHQHANPHHWQHWVLRNDNGSTVVLEMPEKYVVEMVCDWEGAGRAITGKSGTTLDWYSKNFHKMLLHPDTRTRVEELLKFPALNAHELALAS